MTQFWPTPLAYVPHPLAALFPLMEGAAFDDLVADIAQHGVREPVVMLDQMVLDGRNRYLAARESGAAVPVVEFMGGDPLAAVISLNLRRRHLNESQRGMVAAKIAKLPPGRPSEDKAANLPGYELPTPAPTQAAAAEMLNVSERTIRHAAVVQDKGVPELVAMAEAGSVAVSLGAEIARLPEVQQQELVARGPAEIKAAYKQIRKDEMEDRRVERVAKIVEISRGNVELSTGQRYPLIYADPPWRYENPPMGATNRSIENHYPTMTLEEICALPVGEIANEDAVLFLWATAPKLAECMTVIEAWGFNYRTCMVWVKDKIGMGYHARNQHELLLIAKRGEIPPPPPSARPSSVMHASRDEPSSKPHEYYALIESMYPDLPKIELFCRTPQPGWAVWGNQAEAA